MSLLTAPIVENSHIQAGNLHYLSKKHPEPNLKSLSISNFYHSEKIEKAVIKLGKLQHFFAT